MTVSNIKRPSTVAKAFVEACERLQHPRNPDFNGERIDGVGFAPLNVHNGWRRSTAVGYLRPNLERTNLELMTKTHVRRILFEGKRAVGVEVERDGKIQRIGARRELIVSGGAINSPVLLLASGIGPAGRTQAARHRREARPAGRRQEPAGSLPGELRVQDQQRRHAQRSRDEPGQVGPDGAEWLFAGAGPACGRRHRGDAVRQVAARPSRCRSAVPVPEFLVEQPEARTCTAGRASPSSSASAGRRAAARSRCAMPTGQIAAANSRQLPDRTRRHARSCWRGSASAARSPRPSRSVR